jgi:hypothetical protein
MNKLHVALTLLKLLNEKKEIDSALVAGELNVSIRTAQRYLCELSSMPCVSHDEQSRKYSLVEEYPLKKALLGCMDIPAPQLIVGSTAGGALQLRDIVCKQCGGECEPLGGYHGVVKE